MHRREFITVVGGAVFWPLAARAQNPSKSPLLGYLTNDSLSADLPRRNAFRQGLSELGYDEGRNIRIEYRTAAGQLDKLSEFSAEFRRLSVDVILAFTGVAARAASKEMPSTPIVSITPDPVIVGLVASIARPGGNITGFSTLAGIEIYGKYLELLKEVVADITRVTLLTNPANPFSVPALKAVQTAAPTLGLSIQTMAVDSPDELETAVSTAARERAGGLLVMQDAMFLSERTRLAEFVAKYRLPAIYGIREHAEAGGLMAYAASRPEMFRRAASYVDKILKGAKPAELPIEQPTKFELVINLKTAKALGLTIPGTVLVRADQVIE